MSRSISLLVLLVTVAIAGEASDAVRQLTLRVDCGDAAVPLVRPGHESELAIVISNPTGQGMKVRCSGTLSEFDGTQRDWQHMCELPAGGNTRVPIAVGTRTGIRYLDYVLEAGGATVEGRRSFLYASPAGSGPDPSGFLFGVASHPQRGSAVDRRREMVAASQIGLRVMRTDALWHQIEAVPEAWNWERMDELMDLASTYDMELQVILSYGTKHAARPSARWLDQIAALEAADKADAAWWIQARSAQEDGAWRRFVSTIVQHCQGHVRLWEVWNEPDLTGFYLGSTDDYVRMLRSAYAEIKRLEPEALVLTGGFAGVGGGDERFNTGLQERVLREESGHFDVHAFHGHGPFRYFQPTVDGELKRMRSVMANPKPLYFNETALSSAKYGEQAQAFALVKKLAFGRARGAIGYTWYDLRNDGTDSANDEHNYGLLTRDFQPKAVYAAYNELVKVLRGTRPLGELMLGAGRHCYVFAGAGQRVMVVWNEDTTLSDIPVLLFAEGCAGGQMVDMMGNASELSAHDQVVLLRTITEPSYILLPGGESMPKILGNLLNADDVLATPGEAVELVARAINPLPTPMRLHLVWQAPQAQVQDRRIELQPRTSIDLPIATTCPLEAAPGRPARLCIAYAVEGTDWRGTASLNIHAVRRIPVAAPTGRHADFAVAGVNDVVNFFEADPSQSHMLWRGPDDLSARVWLHRDDGRLSIRVEVRDDVHHQPYDAGGAWRGDGVQVAFQVLGQTGLWEIGAAIGADGKVLPSVWITPQGSQTKADSLVVICTPTAEGIVYEIGVPYAAFGLSDEALEHGIRFNLIVNDSDGTLRKGFIRIAPGIGEKKDPVAYPIIRFDRR